MTVMYQPIPSFFFVPQFDRISTQRRDVRVPRRFPVRGEAGHTNEGAQAHACHVAHLRDRGLTARLPLPLSSLHLMPQPHPPRARQGQAPHRSRRRGGHLGQGRKRHPHSWPVAVCARQTESSGACLALSCWLILDGVDGVDWLFGALVLFIGIHMLVLPSFSLRVLLVSRSSDTATGVASTTATGIPRRYSTHPYLWALNRPLAPCCSWLLLASCAEADACGSYRQTIRNTSSWSATARGELDGLQPCPPLPCACPA